MYLTFSILLSNNSVSFPKVHYNIFWPSSNLGRSLDNCIMLFKPFVRIPLIIHRFIFILVASIEFFDKD